MFTNLLIGQLVRAANCNYECCYGPSLSGQAMCVIFLCVIYVWCCTSCGLVKSVVYGPVNGAPREGSKISTVIVRSLSKGIGSVRTVC